MKEIKEKLFNDYVTMNGGDIISAEGEGEPEPEPEQEPEQGTVLYANSCSYNDVVAAINQASIGDTIIVPNGTATWGSQLYITKGIKLKAASVGGVTITAGFEGTNYGWDNFLIRFEPTDIANNKTFRLSGFKLDCNNKVDAILLVNTSTTEEINQVRIDHNEIYNLQTDINARYLETDGLIWGVADNNIFHNDDTDTVYRTWQALGYQGGQYIWQNHPFNFGSEKQFYFEDNTFYTKNILVGCGAGGRYCLRHNNIIVQRDSPILLYLFDIHGNMGAGQNWGGIGCEIYDNTIDLNECGLNMIDARGGKSLIYNNTLINMGEYGWQQEISYQIREEFNDSLNPPAKHSVSGQPQYVSETYFFNLIGDDTKRYPVMNVPATIDYGESEGIVPREDFNYFREKADFDGSSGIGVGTLAERPSTCTTEGVGWWATDENKLYRWHNDAWELYYTPYTYPHPLTVESGGETPPPPPPPPVVEESNYFDLSDSIGASIIIHAKGENELADGDITFIFSFYKPDLGGVWSFVDSDPYVISLNGINDVCATFVIPYNVKKIQLKSIEYDDDETNSALVNVSLNKLCFDNFEQADSLVSSLKAVINEQKRPKV